MKIVIIGQEEAVYFGPFLRGIIEAKSEEVVLVAIAGRRGAGSHPKTVKQKLRNLYILWLIMEPYGFLRNLSIRLWQELMVGLGPLADKRSIEKAARKYSIPVFKIDNINDPDFINRLKQVSCDVIINQSELILKEEILEIPKLGVINRHASFLPRFRGRLGSFWSHFDNPPEYAVTIHFVDKELDAGGIILQRKMNIDPRSSYTKVLDILFAVSSVLILEALEKLSRPDFAPQTNDYQGTSLYKFPTLDQAKDYRKVLRRRRKGDQAKIRE